VRISLTSFLKVKLTVKQVLIIESGTGMGMLFCKDLVEKCSGKIWVTSKQGQGTEFSFTVPSGLMKASRLEVA